MWTLSLRTVRTRTSLFAGSLVAVLLAVVLITAAGTLVHSGNHGVPPQPNPYRAADALVRPRSWRPGWGGRRRPAGPAG